MRPLIPVDSSFRLRSRILALGAALVACLALQACLNRGPGDADLIAILMQVQSDRPAGAPDAIEIQARECKLMAHGQSYDCNVEFVQTRDGVAGLPRRAYLIVSEVDENWRLISYEPKKLNSVGRPHRVISGANAAAR